MCEFPGQAITHPDVSGWVGDTRLKWDRDPDIGPGRHGRWHKIDTPVTMSRNLALEFATRERYDYVLFVDADMSPDLPYAEAKPFWETSWEFVKRHDGPCVIAAPYCGPPPYEAPYVFTYTNTETDDANPNFQLSLLSRQDAARQTGIVRVAAMPTGLMLIDLRALSKLKKPYFDYEWSDEGPVCSECGQRRPGARIHKASTEDLVFCRNLDSIGVPIYCNFDAWAGHWKLKRVLKPQVLGCEVVPLQIQERAAEIHRERTERHAAGRAKPPG